MKDIALDVSLKDKEKPKLKMYSFYHLEPKEWPQKKFHQKAAI